MSMYPISGYGVDISKYRNAQYNTVLDYVINSFSDLADSIEHTPCNWDYNQEPQNGAYIYIADQPSVQDKQDREIHRLYYPLEANRIITSFFKSMLELIQYQTDVYYLEQPLTNKDIETLSNDFEQFVDQNAKHFNKVIKY